MKIIPCIIGLGYVGLPLLITFAKKYSVIGFDVNQNRVEELKLGIDNTKEISTKKILEAKNIEFTSNDSILDIMWNANKKTTPKDDYYIVYRKAIFYELLSLIDKIINNYGDERFTNEQENTNEVKHLLDLFSITWCRRICKSFINNLCNTII